jgi:hypothetical protein
MMPLQPFRSGSRCCKLLRRRPSFPARSFSSGNHSRPSCLSLMLSLSRGLSSELVLFLLCRTQQQQVAASILSPANCLTTVAWRFPAGFHLNSPLVPGFDYLSASFSLGFICTAIPVRSGGKWWLKFRWGLDEGGGRETGGGGLRVEEGARFRFRRHMKRQGGIRVLKPVALN